MKQFEMTCLHNGAMAQHMDAHFLALDVAVTTWRKQLKIAVWGKVLIGAKQEPAIGADNGERQTMLVEFLGQLGPNHEELYSNTEIALATMRALRGEYLIELEQRRLGMPIDTIFTIGFSTWRWMDGHFVESLVA